MVRRTVQVTCDTPNCGSKIAMDISFGSKWGQGFSLDEIYDHIAKEWGWYKHLAIVSKIYCRDCASDKPSVKKWIKALDRKHKHLSKPGNIKHLVETLP